MPLLGTTSPFLTYFPAVVIAGLIGGYPAGLLATALSIPMADYFSIEPVGEFGITNPVDVQTVVVFTLSCVLVTGANETMHRARRRAFAAEAELALATERERATMKISESERRYRSLFENMLDGFAYCRMLFDERGAPADFLYLDVNAAFAKLTGVADAVGKKVTEMFPGIKESNPELFEIYGRVALTGEPQIFEAEFKPLGVWLSVSVYCPEREHFVAVFDDITERKRAQEEIERLNTDLAVRAAELEEANRELATANGELEAFGYSVAHDLRKPLTVVSGYCQALQELCSDKLDEKCKEFLAESYEGTLRMNRLIDTLLNFSHMARIEPRREKVDLSGMVQEVAVELKLAEPARLATFRIMKGISVVGDASLLRVVLENLLGNAWKYTANREEALIDFGATEIDGKPAYFVRDNGMGFDISFADKLFIPFQRLPATAEFRGHGIGLATVERIIRRHGGRIWAEGEPDKGATFYFTLG
jgi:PAS domain S-box-containing protein